MQFINTGNQEARDAFIRDTPILLRAPAGETPHPLPPLLLVRRFHLAIQSRAR